MKTLIAMIGLTLASNALAQTWSAEDGKLTLVGCYGKQDGIYCDFSFILTNKQTNVDSWFTEYFKIFKQDGSSQNANAVAFIDNNFDSYRSSTKEIIANVPVKVQAYFNVPSSISSLRALSVQGVKFDNIPVRPYGATSTIPTQIPAGPSVTGFAISLSNCQLQGQNYVCVATLTPTK